MDVGVEFDEFRFAGRFARGPAVALAAAIAAFVAGAQRIGALVIKFNVVGGYAVGYYAKLVASEGICAAENLVVCSPSVAIALVLK